jgi:catechol 2,3-dioxygenase-like lactoylglutathione lyase family enzyme
MIQSLSQVAVLVLDQDSAYDFYVNKLGFEVRTDATMEGCDGRPGLRWLTVGPKSQPEMEIILMSVSHYAQDEEDDKLLRRLVAKGTFGIGVLATEDCWKTYAELSAKGVKFKGEPEEEFYGIQATLQDDSGNWFSMTQPKPH